MFPKQAMKNCLKPKEVSKARPTKQTFPGSVRLRKRKTAKQAKIKLLGFMFYYVVAIKDSLECMEPVVGKSQPRKHLCVQRLALDDLGYVNHGMHRRGVACTTM